MSSLIAIKICVLFQLKSLLFSLFLCQCSNLWHVHNNNYNNNCLFDIFLTQLFPTVHSREMFKHATVLYDCNFTQGWLNSYWLFSCFVLPLHKRMPSLYRTLLKFSRFAFLPSRVRIFILVCPSSLLFLLYLEGVRSIC